MATLPFDLKPLADRAFCGGQNHFTFHTGPHCPPEAGQPGWVYHAGTHMNINRVWWPMAKPFIDYLARGSFLLQQGHFVGDVCFYYGDDAPNFVKPKHIHPTLGYGYDYDVVNTEVILKRMRVENGKLTLPGGLQYEMLVLPDREDMDVNVLKKITMLVQKGATVVGPRPTRSNGLHNYKQRDAEIDRLAQRLWGPCDGIEQKEHRFGEGYIMQGRPLRTILTARGIGPDFWVEGEEMQQQIDYIHQRDGQADMYFVSNASAEPIQAECTFRVFDRAPEIWRPDTGERYTLALYTKTKKGIRIPLSFQPHDAFFVVFRRTIQPGGILSAQDKMPYKAARENGELAFYFKNEGDFAIQQKNKTFPITVSGIPKPLPLEGAWELHFPPGWGAPERTTIQHLESWTAMKNEGIQYFSGMAEYHKDFTLPSEFLKEDIQIHLHLGQVKEMAEITVNGKRVGIVWKPPYAIDITNAAKKGKNRLSIKVANTWNNRLVGDAKNPDQKFTQTNIQYSEMWKVPWEKTPLKESGLMGPVKLEAVKRVVVKLK
ncbi:hypothetical protein GF373_02325 [bacterium]|nr:hypothetical protein [bacterium]